MARTKQLASGDRVRLLNAASGRHVESGVPAKLAAGLLVTVGEIDGDEIVVRSGAGSAARVRRTEVERA